MKGGVLMGVCLFHWARHAPAWRSNESRAGARRAQRSVPSATRMCRMKGGVVLMWLNYFGGQFPFPQSVSLISS